MKGLITKILAPFMLVGTAVAGLFAAVKLGWISEETAFWLVPISFTVIFIVLAVFVGWRIGRIWLWPAGTLAIVQLAGTLIWLFSSVLETIWSPLKWSVSATLAVLVLLLLAWAFSSIRARMLEKKMAEGAGGGTGADLDRIRKDMREALELLRRAGQGRNAVYQLPWFLVMGRPAAGKTVAIKNSELGLPVKRDWVKGVGGTYTADWFFTNELIFLDTPGGWVTEGATDEGQETWRELMRLLRKYRGRQPLDGLIVVVPADDLIALNDDELEEQATNVREVVDLIHEQLDFRFPIYVLVTKCDLVEGFVDFFRGLPSKRRHEILGWSNPDPNESDAEAIVEKGFATVRGRLQNYRLEMLGKVARRSQARRLFFFTEEFRGLEQPLATFTSALFGGDRYSEPPVFRGFYFSSGTQEGAPLGKAISGVAKAFGLQAPQAEAAPEEGNKRSYFLLELFRELMVGDEGLVGRSAAHWWRRRRNTALGVFAPGAIAVTLLLLSGLALILNKSTYNRVKNDLPVVAEQLWETRQDNPLPTEKNIEEALAKTETLRGFHREMTGFSPFRTFGMRRPGHLADRSLDMFAEEFSRTILHPTLLGARAVTQTGTSCIERLNILRSVVWLRTGRRAGARHLSALEKIWQLDTDTQQARAERVRQDLRQQYYYLKTNIDPESFDLLPGFSVLKAAQWIVEDCGQQGSTSALDAYRRWQDQCRVTRTPGDIVGCYQSLNEVIRAAGEDYDGFVRSFEDLKNDLAELVDEVPDGQAARDMLGRMDVAERGTSDCLTRFDKQIITPVKAFVQRPEMIDECKQAVAAGAQRERFANRESVIKGQDELLVEDAKDIQDRIDRFNDDCRGAVEGFTRIDFGVISQASSSYRRVACFERDLSASKPKVVQIRATPATDRPRPATQASTPATTPQQQQPAPQRQQQRSAPAQRTGSGTQWFDSPARINGGYLAEAVVSRQGDWQAELEAIQGAGYSPEQTEYETSRLRGSISGYASGFVKAWKSRLSSVALKDPSSDVSTWLRELAVAPGFTRYIDEAKSAVAAIPADAEPPFDVLGQQVSSSMRIADLDVAGYLAFLPAIADDIDQCRADGAFWTNYRGQIQNRGDVTLVAARNWVRDNAGPGVAGGALTELFERPLDVAENFIFGDEVLESRWKDLVALYRDKIQGTAPLSGDPSDDPIELKDLRELLGQETGAVARILTAAEGKEISSAARDWLDSAERLSSLFFHEGTDSARPLRLVARVEEVDYQPEEFAKGYRLNELKFVVGTQVPKWNPDDNDPLQLEAALFGDEKSELAYLEADVSERKGFFGRMSRKKFRPGEDLKVAEFQGTLAPLNLLAAGAQGAGLEFNFELDWKKNQKGTVKIPIGLSGKDAAPLMELIKNGLPAPPAEIVE